MVVPKTSAKPRGFGAVTLDTQKATDQRKSKITEALQQNNTRALMEAECQAALDSLLRLKASDLCSQSKIPTIRIIIKSLEEIREAFKKTIIENRCRTGYLAENVAVGDVISLDQHFQVFYEIDGEQYSHSLSPYHEFGHLGYGLAYPEADERFSRIIQRTQQQMGEDCLSIGDEFAAILVSLFGYQKGHKRQFANAVETELYKRVYKNEIAPALSCYERSDTRIFDDAEIFNRHILNGIEKLIQAPNMGKVFETIYNKLYAPLYTELIPVLQGKSAQTEFIFNLSPRGLTSVKQKNP